MNNSSTVRIADDRSSLELDFVNPDSAAVWGFGVSAPIAIPNSAGFSGPSNILDAAVLNGAVSAIAHGLILDSGAGFAVSGTGQGIRYLRMAGADYSMANCVVNGMMIRLPLQRLAATQRQFDLLPFHEDRQLCVGRDIWFQLARTGGTYPAGWEDARDDPFKGYEKFAQADWDGDGAEPISHATVTWSKMMLAILPSNLGKPDIAPGADGKIGFEWIRDKGELDRLFLDIGPGSQWRAYWLMRDGTTGRLPGDASSADTEKKLIPLFAKLSR